MKGAFEIEVTMPVWAENDLAVKSVAIKKADFRPDPTATIEIVFEEGTDVVVAANEIYDALTDLGLTGP